MDIGILFFGGQDSVVPRELPICKKLIFLWDLLYIYYLYEAAPVAQLAEHSPGKREVAG